MMTGYSAANWVGWLAMPIYHYNRFSSRESAATGHETLAPSPRWLDRVFAGPIRQHPVRITAAITLTVTLLALTITGLCFAVYGHKVDIVIFLPITTTVACVILSPVFTYPWISLLSQLDHARRELEWLASSDPLTGLLNRRAFLRRAAELSLQSSEECRVVFMIDIDRFKEVNDRHGHDAGDAALCAVAERLSETVKTLGGEHCPIGRIGGDEFSVIMVVSGPEEARRVGEVIRRDVGAVAIVHRGTSLHLSVSIGIAFWQAGEPLTVALRAADSAAYAAKQAGRNTWRLAS